MDRRSFMALTVAVSLTPALGNAREVYKVGLIKDYLAAGETVFIDFTTEWCITCATQKRTLDALRQSNPEYDKNIKFVSVDFDQHGRSGIGKELKIPRRSTLVVLKGDQELGRIVAGTARKQLQGLLDTALTAAMA